MYSNMKNYENICNCLRVIQQDINRKLKSANCWQRTSLREYTVYFILVIQTTALLPDWSGGLGCRMVKDHITRCLNALLSGM